MTLQQLLGIEINARAAALAELVLWIGFLQWHIRTLGNASVAEPVIHDYGNIECRDAVLAYDRVDYVLNAGGTPVTRWDGVHGILLTLAALGRARREGQRWRS